MKRLYIILAASVVTLAMFSQTVTAEGSVWPMFRHDLRHTGRTPYTGPASPELRWTFQTDDGVACSPSLGADGTIYFGAGYDFWSSSADSNLYALNPDGTLKWKFKTLGGVFSSPAIDDDGTIYFGCLDKLFYAVEDSVTYGKMRWRDQQLYPIYSSPAIGEDGTIYVGGLDFRLRAMDPMGNLKWEYVTDWCIFSSPAIGSEGEIYVGSKDHYLYCFEDSLTYPKVRWSHPFGTFYDGHLVDSSPAIGPDGTTYVGVDPYGAMGQDPVPIDTAFYAVNPDGTRKWSFVIEDDGTEASAAIGADGMIYIGAYNGTFYAIRDAGSEPVVEWTFQTGGSIDGSATIDGNGTIYFGSRDSTLYALNPDGSLRWSYRTGGEIESSPTIDQYGNLYIGSFDGKMYAFGAGVADVGVDSVGIAPRVNSGETYIPGAVIQNYRAGALSVDIACVIDTSGVPVYQDTFTAVNLEELIPREVGFDPWTVSPDTGIVYRLTIKTLLDGDSNEYNDTLSVITRSGSDKTTDAGDSGDNPPLFLSQCYPNPFNPSTTIRFSLDSSRQVSLKIFDISGRLIRTLVDGRQKSGEHIEIWNGTDSQGNRVASGVYFYRLEAGSYVETKKMVLLK